MHATSLLRPALAILLSAACALGHAQKTLKAPGAYEPAIGQEGKDVVWVPTTQELVDKMLDMAKVTPRDYVIDLGSGDGRTVITAAKRGARALGIEYNPDMVELSKRNAAKEGVGDKATFVVLRNGKEKTVAVSLGTRSEPQQVAKAAEGSSAALGMKLSRLDRSAREQFNLPEDAKGVIITAIDPDSDASAMGLDVGDLIVQVGGKPVASPADVEKTIKAARGSDRKSVLLLVRKDDQQRFVALPIRKA